MKIKLLLDVPVNPVEGLTEGRVLEVVKTDLENKADGKPNGVWVIGDTGENIKVLTHEYEVA